MSRIFSTLVAGVGGQGNLVVGQILSEAAAMQGLFPVVGQTFGASRRGGSVFTHIRMADYNVGPLIPKGHVDCLIGLEALETLRATIEYCGPKSVVIMTPTKVDTIRTMAGVDEYPNLEDIRNGIQSICKKVYLFDNTALNSIPGGERMLNTFMIGVFAGIGVGPLISDSLKRSIQTMFYDEANLEAFTTGLEAGGEYA